MSCAISDIISFKNVSCSAACLGVGNLLLLLAFYEYSVCTIVAYGLILGLMSGFAMVKSGHCKSEAECNADAFNDAFGILKVWSLQAFNGLKDLFSWTDPYLSVYVLGGSYAALYVTDYINLTLLFFFLFNIAFTYGYKKEEIDKVTFPYCQMAKDKMCEVIQKFPRAQAAIAARAGQQCCHFC